MLTSEIEMNLKELKEWRDKVDKGEYPASFPTQSNKIWETQLPMFSKGIDLDELKKAHDFVLKRHELRNQAKGVAEQSGEVQARELIGPVREFLDKYDGLRIRRKGGNPHTVAEQSPRQNTQPVERQSDEGQQTEQKDNAPPRETRRPFSFYLVVVAIVVVSIAFLVVLWLSPYLGVFTPDDPATFTAALSVFLGVVGTLVGTYFAIKTSSEAQGRAEERVVEAEDRVEAAPEQAKPAWDLARATLDEYFQRNLGQSTLIFWLSVGVTLVGFGVICSGVLRAFQSPGALLPATIATLSGVITEFIGATFLFIYRSTTKQAVDYSKSLERINSVGMAMQILDTMPTMHDPAAPDDLKSRTKATLAKRLVQLAYEGSSGDQRDTSRNR